MPALTITAVNTNDQLTINGHALNTGDGPAAIRNFGGALPTSTPQFAAVTDYWIIRVDANNIKLATSSANALLGTAIDITAVGSGTNVLEIGIPYRRARTYAPLGQIPSADLNAIQDALTAMYDALTGQAQTLFGIVPASEWDEHWRTAGSNTVGSSTNLPPGWTSSGSSSSGQLTDPLSTFVQRHIIFNVSGAGGAYTLTPEFTNYVDDNANVVFETTIQTSSTLISSPASYDVGLQFSHAGGNDYFVVFSAISGAGNWRARSIGSSTINTDTGIALATSTTVRFRIELTGSAVNGQSAGTFRARYYINGALVATNNFTTPGADKIRPYAKASAVGTDNGMRLGRIRYQLNSV